MSHHRTGVRPVSFGEVQPSLELVTGTVGMRIVVRGTANLMNTVEFVDPLQRIRGRVNALRHSRADVPDVEIDAPPRRIAPPQPRPEAPIIDG